jgi:hypothetical protein
MRTTSSMPGKRECARGETRSLDAELPLISKLSVKCTIPVYYYGDALWSLQIYHCFILTKTCRKRE